MTSNSIINSQMLKKDNTAFLTSDNKNFIKMNQQEFLTNTYANLSKENDTISGNSCFQTQSNTIYVNSTYSREYINELKVFKKFIKTIHENEKQQLMFKNRSLQNHVERLKASFSEEVF